MAMQDLTELGGASVIGRHSCAGGLWEPGKKQVRQADLRHVLQYEVAASSR